MTEFLNESENVQPPATRTAADGAFDASDQTGLPVNEPESVQAPATRTTADSTLGAGGQPHAQLLEADEMQSMLARWKDIQAEFVDEPRTAVQDADALVSDLMQRLARMFASERDQIESSWANGNDDEGSTEELRRGLRRYRSFFERLLAA